MNDMALTQVPGTHLHRTIYFDFGVRRSPSKLGTSSSMSLLKDGTVNEEHVNESCNRRAGLCFTLSNQAELRASSE